MKTKFRINLRLKLMASLLAVSIVPIASVSCLTYLSSQAFFRKSISGSLVGLAKLKTQAIETAIQNTVDQVEKMAATSQVISGLAPAVMQAEELEGKSLEYEALNRMLLSFQGDGRRFEELFVADLDGVIWVSSVHEHEGRSVSRTKFFETGLQTTTISTPFLSEITSSLSMIIAAPVKDEQGKVLGVFGARLNLSTLYDLIRIEKGLGETGETLVGKKIGEEILFMAPTRYDDKAALNRKIPIAAGQANLPLQEAVRKTDGFGFLTDYRDQRVLAAWEYIPSLDWGLVVKMDAQEVLKPITGIRNQILGLAVLLFLLTAWLSSMISRGMVGPLRELTQAAEGISRGNLDVKLAIRSKDEVGDLADSFERLVAAVRFLKEEKGD